MIVAKLMGGMGNQMFQYAAGRSLALRHNTSLKLDDSFLKLDTKGAYTKRLYDLGGFKLSATMAGPLDRLILWNTRDSKYFRLVSRVFNVHPHLFNERGHQYQETFLEAPNNIIINGFWQSEKYFTNYEKQIREDFAIKNEYLIGTEEFLKRISETNSVSIHVRRGDYITNQESNNYHGICGVDYYKDAIDLIATRSPNVELFVFSDDVKWCRENLKFYYPTNFVDSKNAYQDLYLMQNCKHNVTANSSFSWWGAWLNTNKNKIVVSPKKWFAVDSINTSDVCPKNWIRL